MRTCVIATAIGAVIALSTPAHASWLLRLMPGRAAAQPTASLVMIDGKAVSVKASISEETQRVTYSLFPSFSAPVPMTLPGRTTGVRLEFAGPATNGEPWVAPRILSVDVIRGGRTQFTTAVSAGLMSLGFMRVTSNTIFLGHGPAITSGGDLSMSITLVSARGPVRINVPASVVASSSGAPYYAIHPIIAGQN